MHLHYVKNVLTDLVASLGGRLDGIRIVPLRAEDRCQVDQRKPAAPGHAGHYVIESSHPNGNNKCPKVPPIAFPQKDPIAGISIHGKIIWNGW